MVEGFSNASRRGGDGGIRFFTTSAGNPLTVLVRLLLCIEGRKLDWCLLKHYDYEFHDEVKRVCKTFSPFQGDKNENELSSEKRILFTLFDIVKSIPSSLIKLAARI